jgi:hypothetical protein
VDLDDVIDVAGEETIGIYFPHFVFSDEGKLDDVLDVFYINGFNALGVHLVSIESVVFVDFPDQCLQTLCLELGEPFSTHGLEFFIPNHKVSPENEWYVGCFKRIDKIYSLLREGNNLIIENNMLTIRLKAGADLLDAILHAEGRSIAESKHPPAKAGGFKE